MASEGCGDANSRVARAAFEDPGRRAHGHLNIAVVNGRLSWYECNMAIWKDLFPQQSKGGVEAWLAEVAAVHPLVRIRIIDLTSIEATVRTVQDTTCPDKNQDPFAHGKDP